MSFKRLKMHIKYIKLLKFYMCVCYSGALKHGVEQYAPQRLWPLVVI
jgi:hypothetical protein